MKKFWSSQGNKPYSIVLFYTLNKVFTSISVIFDKRNKDNAWQPSNLLCKILLFKVSILFKTREMYLKSTCIGFVGHIQNWEFQEYKCMSELKHTSPILIIGNLISLVYLLQCRQTPGQMTMPEVIQQEITKKKLCSIIRHIIRIFYQ